MPGATSALVPGLRYCRTRALLSQQELAERAGVDTASVHRGERGQALRLATIRRLADALGVESLELLAAPPADFS